MKISTTFAVLVCALAPIMSSASMWPTKAAPQNVRRAQQVTPSPTPAPTPFVEVEVSRACFSGETAVQVQGKGEIAMKDVQIGEKILTADNSFQRVFAYGHYNPTEYSEFLKLDTGKDRSLEMTVGHLVFLQGKTNPVRADSVKIGDILRSTNNEGATVTNIDQVIRQGVYSLFTSGGTLVADGIVASSYISLQKDAPEFVEVNGFASFMSQQDYVHTGLAPFRLFCMGVSENICNSYDENGLPHYVAFSISLNDWAHNQNIVLETFFLLAVLILAGACMLLENTFGSSFAPLAVVIITGAFSIAKKGPFSFCGQKAKTI